MDEDKIKWVPPEQLKSEEGVDELLDSPDMEPYIQLAMTGMQGEEVGPQLQALREMPLERRYIWRVASALKWAFADFDTVNVRIGQGYPLRSRPHHGAPDARTPAYAVLHVSAGTGWATCHGQDDGGGD